MTNIPEVGTMAPSFTLKRDGEGEVSLADFAGRKLVLYFYPKASTPGCTQEAIAFNGLRTQFAAADTAILGVSADPVKAQDKFRDKNELGFPLGSDESHEMLEAYGVWGEKSLYGRKFMGITRTTFLIDREGKVSQVWNKVKVAGHADAVLKAAQELA